MNYDETIANIGERIRKIRIGKHISQCQLAEQCEFEKASMSRIESGRTNVTIRTLNKLSKALDVDITEFMKS
jgi:transcriptional regulator with XRE-family HTH domain